MKRPAVIVGGGPGGLAAAIELIRRGVEVTVLEEGTALGGPIGRSIGALTPPEEPIPLSSHKLVQALLEELRPHHSRIELRRGAPVTGVFADRRVQVGAAGHSQMLQAHTLLLATGAHELVVPFPGWTLPGVITLGCLQQLRRVHGVRPGRRIVIAGAGPLVLATAAQLTAAGCPPVAVLLAARRRDLAPLLIQGLGQPSLLLEGLRLLYWLRRNGVRVRLGQAVVRAHGASQVQGVEVARLDESWSPTSVVEHLETDCLAVGHGLVPESALARQLGLLMVQRPQLGGLVPQTPGGYQETSCPGVFVAGDCGGIRGAEVAILQGRLAGLAMAERLSAAHPGDREQMRRLGRRQDERRRSRRAFHRLTEVRSGLYQIMTRDTLVCRCESVRLGDVLDAVASGLKSATELKMVTRGGMGLCQGRFCRPALAAILQRELPGEEVDGSLTVRPPVRPVALECLANTLPPDEP